MKHTPGPWNFDWHGINHDGERICKVCHSEPYVYPNGKPYRNERFDADSFLIAAAPDLLEMCKELRNYLEDWWKAAGRPVHSTEIVLNEADKVIAKAERGEK